MAIRLAMGNEAIAYGAIHAGVHLVSGYPGTPSTEILETIARENTFGIHVEWSVNEKAALEVAAGASYAGARTLVTMKQVGLNVASDPLMTLSYIGVKGGMIIVVADDPGPISSQTEQDTRHFAQYAHLPIFDPATPEEAYAMVEEAFAFSEKHATPVILRPTTRICHSCVSLETNAEREELPRQGFEKDDERWVISPRTSFLNHQKINMREPVMARELSQYARNSISGEGALGVVCGGVSYAYVREALALLQPANCRVMKIATPHPFPADLALSFLQSVERVLVVEELDPVLEDALLTLCGQHHLPVTIHGKRDASMRQAGENSVECVKAALSAFLSPKAALPGGEALCADNPGAFCPPEEKAAALADRSWLPNRPPVLCAGCPHRASFYAVKCAMQGRRSVFCGDIGCYTLGNAAPLSMVDTCLCMGAGITIAQGIANVEPDTTAFAFIGDSTFFHAGIPGVINAVYNRSKITVIVLDNATTAMTGKQPHPGTGETVMRLKRPGIDIEGILRACGVELVLHTDPLDLAGAVKAVQEAADSQGVSAVIFSSPCISLLREKKSHAIDAQACTGCMQCVRKLGCPALIRADRKVAIDKALCVGCGLCSQICPHHAISVKGDEDN